MSASDQVWRLLPDYMRDADVSGVLRAYVGGAAVGLDRAAAFLAMVDPATSVSGTCEPVNPAAAPRAWLPWLGWLLGIDVSAIPDAEVRATIAAATGAHRRGSVGAIKSAVQRTLTGGRSCRVHYNLSGTEPYLITVVTVAAQTPDPAASLAAALTEKPAGIDLLLEVVTGSTWDELAGAYPTWNDVPAALPTWDDVAAWIPEV